ncbi:MAG: hypothetical protein ACXQTG_03960 [Methanoculleaceae archaeon]
MDDLEEGQAHLSPVRKREICVAVANRCDRCGYRYPLKRLVVWFIDQPPESSSSVLILCPECLLAVLKMSIPEAEQRAMAERRPAHVQEEIGAIIRKRSRPITFESSYEPPDIFEDWSYVLNGT